jgi:hypothetical protein
MLLLGVHSPLDRTAHFCWGRSIMSDWQGTKYHMMSICHVCLCAGMSVEVFHKTQSDVCIWAVDRSIVILRWMASPNTGRCSPHTCAVDVTLLPLRLETRVSCVQHKQLIFLRLSNLLDSLQPPAVPIISFFFNNLDLGQ